MPRTIQKTTQGVTIEDSSRYAVFQHRKRLFTFDKDSGRLFEWSEAKRRWVLMADQPAEPLEIEA